MEMESLTWHVAPLLGICETIEKGSEISSIRIKEGKDEEKKWS